MKKLILNADDFGLSRSINEGIIESFRRGPLTSTSLLVNMPGFDDALHLIRENQSLGTGIHINVFRGEPVSPARRIKSLCRGSFFRGSLPALLALAYIHKEGLDEFAIECRAQIEKALSHGIRITHLDSEKHIHIIKPFFKIFLKVAKEYGISKIRCINEIPYFPQEILHLRDAFNKQRYAALYLSFLSKENKKLLKDCDCYSPDYFYGISGTGRMTLSRCERILSNLKEGTTEIMFHPGYIDNEWKTYPLNREKYYINAKRDEELNVLLNPRIRELIKEHNILLTTYRDL